MNRTLSISLLAALSISLAACAGSPAQPIGAPAGPQRPITTDRPIGVPISLIRSPTCSCCAGHAEHLAAVGYDVHSTLTEGYADVKDAHSIPIQMRSCHTSLVGGYFVEGHVPAVAIDRLLAERPDIDGIALPGMPPGSPGMGGTADGPLTVYAVRDGEVVGEFGRFAAE